jgi:hypothetical protein
MTAARSQDVLALDLASVTGWARGRVGADDPRSGAIRFGKPGASHAAIAWHALDWLITFTREQPLPDLVVIEAAVRKEQWRSSHAANDITTGLIWTARGVLHGRGVYKIVEVPVQSVRHFFIGGNPHSDEAKHQTVRKCRALCWDPVDDNAADALALWAYQCSRIDPTIGIKLSPLFNKALLHDASALTSNKKVRHGSHRSIAR